MKEEHSHDSAVQPEAYRWAAVMALPLRLVVGWTYFSAFWRRLVLENKLIPDDPGYIGVKFNHFLPNALGIKPVIEYLVTHPSELWWFMVAFTIIEFLVGLMLMLGLLTRLASVGVFCLALGILLGSGWLGTTCLDEWQIGILGMCAGLLLFLTGAVPVRWTAGFPNFRAARAVPPCLPGWGPVRCRWDTAAWPAFPSGEPCS